MVFRFDIRLFLVLFSLFTLGSVYAIVMPPKQMLYHCHCKKPSVNGVCHSAKLMTHKNKPLMHGWKVNFSSCTDNQTYHLTQGAVIFAGSKIKALYSNIEGQFDLTGYVYHVSPNLPKTKSNYSLVVVGNPRINGIDIKNKHHGWECGDGNRRLVSCRHHFDSARCIMGKPCEFTFSSHP